MKWKTPEQLMFLKNRNAQQHQSKESMTGKLCVITGATSGVGYEAVKKLASAGANIVLVGRNIDKVIKIKNEVEKEYSVFVDYVIADFSDLDQVRSAAVTILKKYQTIDVLINSAGIHSTTKQYNKDGYELVFCVNHLATFLFTKLLLNRMIESSPSRIIQVNSEGHRFNGLKLSDIHWKKRIYRGLKGYGASKTAQLFTVWEFAEQLKETNVTINAMHPGEVRTNIGNNNGKLYRWFLHHVTWKFLKDPSISGDALYYLASSQEVSQINGAYFYLTIEQRPAKHTLDKTKQKLVWELSEQMTTSKQTGEGLQ